MCHPVCCRQFSLQSCSFSGSSQKQKGPAFGREFSQSRTLSWAGPDSRESAQTPAPGRIGQVLTSAAWVCFCLFCKQKTSLKALEGPAPTDWYHVRVGGPHDPQGPQPLILTPPRPLASPTETGAWLHHKDTDPPAHGSAQPAAVLQIPGWYLVIPHPAPRARSHLRSITLN